MVPFDNKKDLTVALIHQSILSITTMSLPLSASLVVRDISAANSLSACLSHN